MIVEVKDGVLTDVAIGVRTISSRSGNGRRVAYCGGSDVLTVCEIDPDESRNIKPLLAAE